MAITDEVIASIKEANPNAELHRLSTPTPWGETIEGIVRVPTRSEWQMSRELVASNDPAKKIQASRRRFDACVLYPSGSQRDALVSGRPGIVDIWSGEIGELAGAIQGTRVEKL